MNRVMLLNRLVLAERHVREGETSIARQRAVTDELERGGRDATDAKGLLRQLTEIQAIYVADRDRLKKQLDCGTH